MESVWDGVFFKDMRGEAARALEDAVRVDSPDGADVGKGDIGRRQGKLKRWACRMRRMM